MITVDKGMGVNRLSGDNAERSVLVKENNMAADERRRHKRYSLQLQAKMTAETAADNKPIIEFLTANIGAGGAFIKTETPLPLTSKVHLEFLLSLDDLQTLQFILSLEKLKAWRGKRVWINATGVVTRHEDRGMGIMFDDNYRINPMATSNTTEAENPGK